MLIYSNMKACSNLLTSKGTSWPLKSLLHRLEIGDQTCALLVLSSRKITTFLDMIWFCSSWETPSPAWSDKLTLQSLKNDGNDQSIWFRRSSQRLVLERFISICLDEEQSSNFFLLHHGLRSSTLYLKYKSLVH